MLRVQDMRLGDEVHICNTRTGDSTGKYRVTKLDKMKVVLNRESDGHERVFSAKTEIERGSSPSSYYRTFFRTVEEQAKWYSERNRKIAGDRLWRELHNAVLSQNLGDSTAALEALRKWAEEGK